MPEVDFDTLSDDDFMQALDDAAYEDSGSTEPEANYNDDVEDTDHTEESEPDGLEDTETNEQIDDEAQDSGELDEDGFELDDEENSQAENNDNQEDSEADDNAGSGETETEAEEANVGEEGGKAKDTGELDYKEEYAKILEEKNQLQTWKNEVTGEFVANGRKTRGFSDPKQIIKAQQMAAGFSEKMVAFKEYRPFMNTLKEKGMLDNPEKFNLAMQLLDGDPEALKKQLKESNIDPFEMDMENINYVQKNQIASNIELALDDVMENAAQSGVETQVREIISNDWDDDSVIELLEDPQNSADLISHINTGIYDIVLDRMADKRRVDANQVYVSKPKIEQYREAVIELEKEYAQYLQQQEAQQGSLEPVHNETADQVQGEPIDWISDIPTEQAEAYKASVEKQNAKTNEARRKATSLSKKKRGTRKPKKQTDPLAMDDDGFTEYMDSIIFQ